MADTARQSCRQSRPTVGGRRTIGRATARGWRGDVRQDHDPGVWVQGRDEFTPHRDHAQSVGSIAYAGGLLRWHRCCRRRGPGARVHGHRWRGKCAYPRGLLRQRRHEGEFRPRAGVPAVTLRHGRPCRTAHDERYRLRAHDDHRVATGPARLDVTPLRHHRLPRRPRRWHPGTAHRLLADARLRRCRSRGSGARRRGGA